MSEKLAIKHTPTREIMKKTGANLVSVDAVDTVRKSAVDQLDMIVDDALKLMRHAKRTKLSEKDIELAIKNSCGIWKVSLSDAPKMKRGETPDIALAPIVEMVHKKHKLVAKEGAEMLKKYAAAFIVTVIDNARAMVLKDGRKKVMKEDVALVMKMKGSRIQP
jgi:histone H3/H4